MRMRLFLLLIAVLLGLTGCAHEVGPPGAVGVGPDPVLPPPPKHAEPVVNVAPAKGWPEGAAPQAAPGTRVAAFARNLEHPRWIYVLPNGDVLVAETAARLEPGTGEKGNRSGQGVNKESGPVPADDRIILLRDTDGNGRVDLRTVLVQGLRSPFGMALMGGHIYVANTDALVRFPYKQGQTRIEAGGEKIVDLPAGPINYHWTRNVIADPDGIYLYVTVGSNSNIGENGLDREGGRAAIWKIHPGSRSARIYALGLRNPVGLAWEPHSGALWTVVNERHGLGNDLVPDYLTRAREGGYYGWPFSYFGRHVDERVQPQEPDYVAVALKPDYGLGAHTAAMGLASAKGARLPEPFRDGMFVSQHGSRHRRPFSGYKVVFVPFDKGEPSGYPIDVLAGFLSPAGEALGRPSAVAVDTQGALLVADDVGHIIWRVTADEGKGRQPNS
jgi:glucose/arabinose dehydrogenase